MKLIKKIRSEEHGDMELFESDLILQPHASKFVIWFNGSIIDDAKTLKGALNKLRKKSIKNNLINE